MSEKLLLTTGDAAKLLGVDDRSVQAAIDSGQLRTVVLLKRRLIPRAAIEELVNGRANGEGMSPDPSRRATCSD